MPHVTVNFLDGKPSETLEQITDAFKSFNIDYYSLDIPKRKWYQFTYDEHKHRLLKGLSLINQIN